MARASNYDVDFWQTHITEDDCDLIIRTNNGRLFYCHFDPSRFCRSPKVTEQYFMCLNVLRSDEEEMDGIYLEDACDWLMKPFEPLIAQLAPATLAPPLSANGRPTLSQYLFPLQFACTLDATDDQLRVCQLDTQEHNWSTARIAVNNDFVKDLDKWTQSYHPSNVEICYDYPRNVLIKPPTRVVVARPGGGSITCFFKSFRVSFGKAHAKNELLTLRKIAIAQIPPPPQVLVCRLHGVVRDGNGLLGMLFTWIDKKAVLSRGLAAESSAELRQRWATQIDRSLKKLHQQGIIWGDVKPENVLIDTNDDAWIIDFGGSYTPGWVDPEMAGTLEGDLQGLVKITEMLRCEPTGRFEATGA
ncbi:hypothetical protein F5Y09DRAFT_226225 [Xylaria sp. FL1042]|nr:hypothetical protein F5Y09DRAFT_226225 [Xylaria sp. FL1042]